MIKFYGAMWCLQGQCMEKMCYIEIIEILLDVLRIYKIWHPYTKMYISKYYAERIFYWR